MAFRFSLATVLRFRESLEKREELALQKLLMEMAGVHRDIENLTEEIARAEAARYDAMQQPLLAFRLQGMLLEIQIAIQKKAALIESLARLDQQRKAQTAKYQAVHRDRQMLSDMSTRLRDAYERECNRAQQKFLDDVFAARAQRS